MARRVFKLFTCISIFCFFTFLAHNPEAIAQDQDKKWNPNALVVPCDSKRLAVLTRVEAGSLLFVGAKSEFSCVSLSKIEGALEKAFLVEGVSRKIEISLYTGDLDSNIFFLGVNLSDSEVYAKLAALTKKYIEFENECIAAGYCFARTSSPTNGPIAINRITGIQNTTVPWLLVGGNESPFSGQPLHFGNSDEVFGIVDGIDISKKFAVSSIKEAIFQKNIIRVKIEDLPRLPFRPNPNLSYLNYKDPSQVDNKNGGGRGRSEPTKPVFDKEAEGKEG